MVAEVLLPQARINRNSLAVRPSKLCCFFSVIMCGVQFPQIYALLRATLWIFSLVIWASYISAICFIQLV